MHLKTLFVRFYKSFNFDYLRKYHPKAEQKPWESLDGLWYPYVQIPIDPQVTTIVGANEFGKSHLLTAIEKGISGSDIKREDFCRYSQFFTVELGKMKWPDFGFEWAGLSSQDQQQVRTACGIPESTAFDRFFVFRTQRDRLSVYLPTNSGYARHDVKDASVSTFPSFMPHVFRIDADVALPSSVPIRKLAEQTSKRQQSRFERLERIERFELLDNLADILVHPELFKSVESITAGAPAILPMMSSLFKDPSILATHDHMAKQDAEFLLAHDLICKIARIDPEALLDLDAALRDGKEGHANGIIQKINDHLAASLNFPRWWVQDRDFRLVVSPREYDLVFTIRDRTETEYSFAERSSGLKYFLSYYVQYRAHKAPDERPEILLMDEPDAYLSSQAQQDLLKIFAAFAAPEDGTRPVQVIYVTHSPFLIDKNHAERIRVLEKGIGEEGTRVVKDAAKNHYEPLRSAFGAFVGETTFIGNCNLMVEGQSDQILVAGTATYLRAHQASALETLDLNHVTIVPAGSASHIPYLVYLARGRDVEKPAVVVLLDSDSSGTEARKRLIKGGPNNKQVLKDAFIFQIGDLTGEDRITSAKDHVLIAIEDLIPLPICVEAARNYMREICGAPDEAVQHITEEAVRSAWVDGCSCFDAIDACIGTTSNGEYHIEKVGFARNVIDVITDSSTKTPLAGSPLPAAVQLFEDNMKTLFRRLNKICRDAERELTGERVSQRVSRAKNAFLQDHPQGAKREQAVTLLDDIDASLDDTQESDSIRVTILKLRRDFQLDSDLTEAVSDYSAFRESLERIKYAGRLATQVQDRAEASLPVLQRLPEIADPVSTSTATAPGESPLTPQEAIVTSTDDGAAGSLSDPAVIANSLPALEIKS